MIIRKVEDSKSTIWRKLRRRKKAMTILTITMIYFTFYHGSGVAINDGDDIITARQLQDGAFDDDNGGIVGRVMKKNKCTHTPYVLIGDIVVTMPPVPPISERIDPPSYVQLCQEFINRSEAGVNEISGDEERNGNNGGGIRGVFSVVEDESICTDWEAPHYNILSIYASSLIAAVGKGLGLRYKHNCRRHIPKMHNDPSRHYDYTSVQALLPENLIASTDAEKVTPELVTELCNRCIWDYENVDQLEYKSGVTHHCILMPDEDSARSVIDKNMELPMVSVLPSLIDRLRHMADDWIVTTGHPDGEGESGVIIAVDEKSQMMSLDVYEKIIPTTVTSIQIFASASCGIAHVQGASSCIEHGRMLKRHFIQSRSQYGTYVRYDVVGSSAASFSRMIEARITICPPGTVMCLLPALGKRASKKAYIAEDVAEKATFHWFEEHVLQERKRLGFEEVGFDAVPDSDYLDIISDVGALITEEPGTVPFPTVGQEEEHENNQPIDEQDQYNYQQWTADGRSAQDEEQSQISDQILPKSFQDIIESPGAPDEEQPETPPLEQPQVPDEAVSEVPPEDSIETQSEEPQTSEETLPGELTDVESEVAMEAPPEKPTSGDSILSPTQPEEETEQILDSPLPEGAMEAPPEKPESILPDEGIIGAPEEQLDPLSDMLLPEGAMEAPAEKPEIILPDEGIIGAPEEQLDPLPDMLLPEGAMEAPPEKTQIISPEQGIVEEQTGLVPEEPQPDYIIDTPPETE